MAEDNNNNKISLKQAELKAQSVKALEDGNVALANKLSLQLELLKLEEELGDKNKGTQEQLEKIIKLKEQINKLEKEQTEELEKQNKLEKEQTEEKEKQNRIAKQGIEIGRNFANQIISVNNQVLQQIGRMEELENNQNNLLQNIGATLKQIGKGFFEEFTPTKAAIKFFDKIITDSIALIKTLDAIEASFVQNTGASREFATEAFQLRRSLSTVGITGQEAVATMNNLYSSMSEFSQLSESSRKRFTELSAQIEKLGGDAAGMGQTFTKVAGMSIPETEASMMRLAGVADSLGVPFSQISSDVEGLGDLFAKMGDEALDVFVELQAAAKETGLSVQDLYGIVSEYDSFENASAAAGRLNMVLGGNLLDTYSLLAASEEERIELLQNAMALSGQTFDEMDRFQVLEIASALGISAEQARQLFGTTRGEVRKTAAELMHAGMTQEELAQRAKDAATAMDKFSILMGNVAIFVGPIVEKLNGFVDGLLSIAEAVGPTKTAFGLLTVGMLAAVGAGMLLRKLFKDVLIEVVEKGTESIAKAVEATSEAAGEAVETAGESTAGAINDVGEAATKNRQGIVALGGAIFLIGAGVAVAALGMAKFVAAFAELEGGQIAGAVVGILALGVAMAALAGILAVVAATTTLAAGPLLAIGGAIALIGVGIGAAAWGMAQLVASFAGLKLENLLPAVLGINLISASLAGLAIAVISFTSFGLGALILVGAAIYGLVTIFNKLNETKLQSFSKMVSSLTQLKDLAGSGAADFIREISSAINDLPDDTTKMVNFKTTADSLTGLMNATAAIEEAKLENIRMIIEGVSNSEGNENVGRLADAINSLTRQQGGDGQPNVIELDGRVLARWMDKREARKIFSVT